MSVTQGQTTYTQFSALAVPGQLADLAYAEIVAFPAGEVIHPGRLVQLASDGLSCQEVRNSSASTPPTQVLGVAILQTAREGSGAVGITAYGVGGPNYILGETVPVLMRGRVYAEWKGTTQSAFVNGLNGSGALHVYASSTVATDRGKFTDASVSAGAGTEVAYAGQQMMTRQTLPGGGEIVLIDVNFPSAA
jgi:hypothetical protein